jgi:hypothetical protein
MVTRATAAGGKDTEETVGGRVVIHYANGSPSVWGDTGEAVDAATLEEHRMLYAGAEAAATKHEAINAPILFWVKTFTVGEEEKKNPIRGMVLGFFEPPPGFAKADEDEKDVDEGGVERERLACWLKITLPCYVKDQNKAVVLAPVGSIVWVDVIHANTALARAARPKLDLENAAAIPVGLVEVQVDPLRKVSFPSPTKKGETWSAWRMRVSGGWQQAADDARTGRKGGFRTLDAAAILKLAHRMVPPEILDVEAAARLAGVRGPAALDVGRALPPSAERGAPALPAHTAN